MRVISRTIGALLVTAGQDEVMAWAPMPEGATLVSVSGSLHVVGEEGMSIAQFGGYGFSGHVVPVDEMETALDIQSLWDQVVVKALDPTASAGTEQVDFDVDTIDSNAEIQPGEMDVNAILGLAMMDKEFIAPQMRMLSWAKSRQGGHVVASPDVFNPSDYVTFRSQRRIVADVPSMALIGVSSLAFGDRVQTIETPGTVGEWGVLGNMKLAMNQMLIGQLGLTEIGAESPHAEISGFIAELAAPDILDESVTLFDAQNFTCLMEAVWLLEMPDTSIPGVVDGR